MKFKVTTTVFALLLAGFTALTLSLSTGAASASEASERNRALHVTKDCSQFTGAAGDYCTITSSNLAAIKVGSKVYYDQAAGTPTGFLDSNALLDVGTGDWAVGRCTLDLNTGLGLCTFSDGTGKLTGFRARVNVSPFPDFVNYHWDGTYSFSPEDDRDRDR